jgi:uncharacterized protein (TIGR03437 family)
MKNILTIIAIFGLFGTAGFAQPTVSQISNAASASLSVPGPEGPWETLPNGSIAQGSYFTVYGNGFGGAAAIWNPYPLPTELSGTSVSITVGQNPPVAAYIEFAAQLTGYSQLNAILPSSTPLGAGTLTVTYKGQTSAPAPINVVASSFGAFAQNQAGDGPGIVTDVNYRKFTPSYTAKPGQVVILWGTGLGPAPDPSTEASAAPCPNTCDLRGPNLSVTVWVGGQEVQPANLYYAGRSGFTGEDEIIFYVPSGVTTGCYLSVAVQTGPPGGAQVTSNFTSIPVDANGATCQDADGVNMNDIAAAVQSKGSANVAAIGLLSTFWNINLTGTFIQWWDDSADAQIATFGPAALDLFRGFTRLPSVNSCVAIPYLGYPPPPDYGLGYAAPLDAGSALGITGPLAATPVAIPKNANGAGYDGLLGGGTTADDGVVAITGLLPPFYWNSTSNGDGTFTVTDIASGNYTVTGPGGAVSAFSGIIDVSSAAAGFVWTNAGTFDNQNGRPVIPRNAPLNITWTGGDPDGFVDIALIGSTVQNLLPSATNPEPGVYVDCVVPASKGSFSVPTYVLQALPQTAFNGTPSNSDIPGLVLVGPASGVSKISPVPTGLDAAYLYYRFISGYTVDWQ